MNHRQIIELWPTVADLARDLKIDSARVYKWHERQRIPPEFWITMIEFARNRDIALDIEDLAIGAQERAKERVA